MDNVNSNRKLQIGVLLGNSTTEHPREIISGIFDIVQEENVKITFFLGAQGRALDFWDENGDFDSVSYNYQYNSLYNYALIADMDALIIAYGTLCIYFTELEQISFLAKFKNIPLVIMEKYEENSSDTYLMTDNYGSMKAIMEHLILVHGYKKILHVSGPKNSLEGSLRKKAYLDAMHENGLTVIDSMIAEGDFTPNVEHIIEKLLDDNPDAEAINCANDETAIAAYKVCNQRGIVVGQDLAITGYDDIDTAAKLDPPLTTANQDGTYMGYRAVKAAVDACTRKGSNYSGLITAPLVVRGSCGCDFLAKGKDAKLYNSYSQIRDEDDDELIRQTAIYALDVVRRKKNMPEDICNNFTKICERLIKLLIRIRHGEYKKDDRQDLDKFTLDALRQMIGGDYERFTHFISINRMMTYARMLITYEINTD